MSYNGTDHSSCTKTGSGFGVWWEVDLGAVYEIQEVVITSTNNDSRFNGNTLELCSKLYI